MNQATDSPFLLEIELDGSQMRLLDLLCEDLTYSEIADRLQRTLSAVSQELNQLTHVVKTRSALGLAVWWIRSRSALYGRPKAMKKTAASAA
jgi:DNA-binding CsgD family transcriptional regulator